MPNHTDCRLRILGSEEALFALETALASADTSLAAAYAPRGPETPQSYWNRQFKRDPFSGYNPPQTDNPFPLRGALSFTFEVAIPMPKSLHVVEGSSGEAAYCALYGSLDDLRAQRRFMDEFNKSGQPFTREKVVEFLQANHPDEVAIAKIWKHNEDEHGSRSWYDWCIRNWGTKWDAYSVEWKKFDPAKGEALVHFNTAWSPPVNVISRLCKKFGLHAVMGYTDEGGSYAAYAKFAPDGSMDESEDFSDGYPAYSKVWSGVREAANEIKEELKKSKPAGRRKATWLTPLRQRKPYEKALHSKFLASAEKANGVDLPEYLASQLHAGNAEHAPALATWLQALADERPDLLVQAQQGKDSLAEAVVKSGWVSQYSLALAALDSDRRAKALTFALSSALMANEPAVAAAAYEALDPSLRPDFLQCPEIEELFKVAPAALAELCASPAMPPDQLVCIRNALDGVAEKYFQRGSFGEDIEKAKNRIDASCERHAIGNGLAPGAQRPKRGP